MMKAMACNGIDRDVDTIVYLVKSRNGRLSSCSDRRVAKFIRNAFATGDFAAKEGEILVHYPPPAARGNAAERVLVAGLGDEKVGPELLRRLGGSLAGFLAKTRAKRLGLVIPGHLRRREAVVARHLLEGLLLGSYRFLKYRAKNDDDEPGDSCDLAEVVISGADPEKLKMAIERAMIDAGAVCFARDMANEPGNFWTPAEFERAAREISADTALSCRVMQAAAMKKQGLGGLLGVNQGSAQPPKLICLEYRVDADRPTLLLVGKGLTFDSGGISLKPGAGMEEMKYDMCGGAAVLAVMKALAEIGPETMNVVGLIPATDNLPGPNALKPGDIITQYNGKTVEVVNTDAEGRLILADAISYGAARYSPDYIIDLATLTGAVIIGLGHHLTGLLSNDEHLSERILKTGVDCGEPSWRLPLGKEYRKQLKSKVADLKNIGGRPGGTITAACFLEEFVGDIPWAHLDIAGTAWNYTKKTYVPEGPSGVGVRTLIELICNW